MAVFPHERPMTIPQAFDLDANEDFFNEFEGALQAASNSAHNHADWKKDYNYFYGGTQQQYVICRTIASPTNLNNWVYEVSTQSFLENADWDLVRNQLDMSKVPAHAASSSSNGCPGCGMQPYPMPNGMLPAFCPGCGASLAGVSPMAAPMPNNPNPAPVAPGGISVHGPATAASTSVRMTGKQQEAVVIPEGLGRGDSKKQEQDWLDKVLAAGDAADTTQEEPKPDA